MVNTWKIVLAALVIFMAGVFTGGVTVELAGKVLHHDQQPAWPRPNLTDVRPMSTNGPFMGGAGWRGPGSMRIQAIRRAEVNLSLTAAQKDKVDGLLRDTEQSLRTIWQPIGPQVQKELRGLESQIEEVLSPEQRTIFREVTRRRFQDNGVPAGTNSSSSGTNSPAATNAPGRAGGGSSQRST